MTFEDAIERIAVLREERAFLFCSLVFVTTLWLRERNKNRLQKEKNQKEGE